MCDRAAQLFMIYIPLALSIPGLALVKSLA